MMDSVVAPEVADLSRTLLRSFGYRGMANIEFKFDARDGSYRLIEINPRSSGALQLAVSAGIDFPFLVYDYLARRPERTAGAAELPPRRAMGVRGLGSPGVPRAPQAGRPDVSALGPVGCRRALVGGRGAERSDAVPLPDRGVPARSRSQGARPIPHARRISRTMRVLHVQRAKGIGGSERHLLTLLPALQAAGVDVRMCVLAAPGGERFVDALRAAGVDTTVRSAGPDLNPLAVTGLVGEIRALSTGPRAHAPGSRGCSRPARRERRARCRHLFGARHARLLPAGALPQRGAPGRPPRASPHRDLRVRGRLHPARASRARPTASASCPTASTPARWRVTRRHEATTAPRSISPTATSRSASPRA